jgi:hypothetical protein
VHELSCTEDKDGEADEIALVFLMSHMFKLRAKVMRKGKGRTVGTKKTN